MKRVPHLFDDAVVAAVLRHMNSDHTDDNVLIVRAFAAPSAAEITDARMTGFDGDAGAWEFTRAGRTEAVRVPWPGGSITERGEVRREVVALYDAANEALGFLGRPHD